VPEIAEVIALLKTITTAPDALNTLMENLRPEMEIPQSAGVPFRGSMRNFAQSNTNWRAGGRFGSAASTGASGTPSRSAFDTREPVASPYAGQKPLPRQNPGRYQSRFTSGDKSLDDKILHTIIGNKLNAFTPGTYNDTRDFIYQIMDSGETEFARDFVEKVFTKATLEELYCGLFAKLIAEIAHRYPVMYEEMGKYHREFLDIFDDVQQHVDAEYSVLLKKKQYRMGYGHFLSELAGQNALEKEQLFAMVEKVMEKICALSDEAEKVKTVEEFVDCIVRLTKSLRERSPKFFKTVQDDLKVRVIEKAERLLDKSITHVSLSSKARFGIMDLRDLIVDA